MTFRRGLDPLTDPPRCDHGRMVRTTGYSKARRAYWAAFMCATKQPMCPPRWVDVDAIISEALGIWRGFVADESAETDAA
jgi:hypothetical protein